ncbi:YoaK family protein [Halomonas hibernica]|uniref:YoaK family protein n=2 Tax=Halomonas TaxID=2745 RepID=UPI001554429E|nr:YoaK family protein [Halomonas hibernica]
MSNTASHTPLPDHPEAIRFPLMELPLVGFLLAFMAGSMNAWTFANAETFATVQSGNVVQIGYWLIQGNWDKFMAPFLSVIAFGIGSAICGAIMTNLLSHHRIVTRAILFLEFLILAVLIWLVWKGEHNVLMIAYTVSFIAGMQGNAFHKSHGMLYGNVAVTFVVQMAFNFLIQSFFNKKGINGEPNLMWAGIFFLVLLGFAGGGAIGFFIDRFVTAGALILPALIALILIVIVWRDHDRHQRVDTLPGGNFA